MSLLTLKCFFAVSTTVHRNNHRIAGSICHVCLRAGSRTAEQSWNEFRLPRNKRSVLFSRERWESCYFRTKIGIGGRRIPTVRWCEGNNENFRFSKREVEEKSAMKSSLVAFSIPRGLVQKDKNGGGGVGHVFLSSAPLPSQPHFCPFTWVYTRPHSPCPKLKPVVVAKGLV